VKAFDYNNPFDLARSFLGRGETAEGKPMSIEPDFEVDAEDVASRLAHALLALVPPGMRPDHALWQCGSCLLRFEVSDEQLRDIGSIWCPKCELMKTLAFVSGPHVAIIHKRGCATPSAECSCGLAEARKAAGL